MQNRYVMIEKDCEKRLQQITMKITQQEVINYMIDVLGYSQEDISDFDDDTSVYKGRLQDVLSKEQYQEMLDYYSWVNK